MPGGICSLSLAMLNGAAVRCAEVQFSMRGSRHQVFMGGCAHSVFEELDDASRAAELTPGQTLTVNWSQAVFYGEHPHLGGIFAYLGPAGAAATHNLSSVASLQAEATTPPGSNASYFPARNRNLLAFRLALPNLGLVYDGEQPIENEAVIDRIPPYGSVYKLAAPVPYRVNGLRSALARGAAGADPGDLVLEDCNVKLMELKDLRCDIQLTESDRDSFSYAVTIVNESTEDEVSATWMVWPRPEEAFAGAEGVVELDRTAKTIRLRLPRDIFYRERWLALSLTRPFETDGAFAGVLPVAA